MKIVFQVLTVVALFFAIWFSLERIDWMTILKVEKVTRSTEEKLGDMFWEMFDRSGKGIHTSEVMIPLDSILTKICTSNKIDIKKIKLHIIKSDEINAFALPNNHLVLCSELIISSEDEAELAGVISHELAHLQLNHVMKKLVKEVGLSVLISMVAGESGGKIIEETAKLLSSTAYDRKLEKEADIKAVDYLMKANINPEPFANFMYKLADKELNAGKHLVWISTHPGSIERAKYIIDYSKGKSKNALSILSKSTWDKLKENLKEQ